jgi:hypothetical protein
MSHPLYMHIYNNGNIYISNEYAFTPGVGNESSNKRVTEAGTLVKVFQFNSDLGAQKITTLGGTVSSSLTATGGTTAKSGSMVEIT